MVSDGGEDDEVTGGVIQLNAEQRRAIEQDELLLEVYRLEIEDLQSQIDLQENEVAKLQSCIEFEGRVKDFEQRWRLRGVKVVSSSEGFVELHLTTHVPICQHANSEYKERLVEHELQLKLDPNTMALEDAQLSPEDVPIDDIVSEAKRRSCFHSATLVVQETEELSKQIGFLVTEVQQHIRIYVLKTEVLALAAQDPRYVLEYLPDTAIICATLPDGIVANLEAPYGWPMPGIALVVRSLILANSSCKANFLSTSQHMTDLANSTAKSDRCDLLQFLHSIEEVVAMEKQNAKINF
ncbi:unnamed protein product [Sphagnum balticum]